MEVSVWVALAAGVPGLVALVAAGWLWRSLQRVRSDQRVLLPDGERASIADRQATLQRAMTRLEESLSDLEDLVESQGETTERELRTTLRFQGLVRYDAYRDMGGSQSWSIALLDSTRSGSVITSLHARDHARVYLKQLVDGVPGQRLSPEEERAVALAMGRPAPPPADPADRPRRERPDIASLLAEAEGRPEGPAQGSATAEGSAEDPAAAERPAPDAGDAPPDDDGQSTGEFPAPEQRPPA